MNLINKSFLPLIFIVPLLLATPAEAASQAGAKYVGSKACQKCHQKVYREWRGTLHAQMTKDAKKYPDAIIGDFGIKSDIRTFTKD
jgi:hypothetical protein